MTHLLARKQRRSRRAFHAGTGVVSRGRRPAGRGVGAAEPGVAVSFNQGKLDEADDRLAPAAKMFHEIGDYGGLGFVRGSPASCRMFQGRFDEAGRAGREDPHRRSRPQRPVVDRHDPHAAVQRAALHRPPRRGASARPPKPSRCSGRWATPTGSSKPKPPRRAPRSASAASRRPRLAARDFRRLRQRCRLVMA